MVTWPMHLSITVKDAVEKGGFQLVMLERYSSEKEGWSRGSGGCGGLIT